MYRNLYDSNEYSIKWNKLNIINNTIQLNHIKTLFNSFYKSDNPNKDVKSPDVNKTNIKATVTKVASKDNKN